MLEVNKIVLSKSFATIQCRDYDEEGEEETEEEYETVPAYKRKAYFKKYIASICIILTLSGFQIGKILSLFGHV